MCGFIFKSFGFSICHWHKWKAWIEHLSGRSPINFRLSHCFPVINILLLPSQMPPPFFLQASCWCNRNCLSELITLPVTKLSPLWSDRGREGGIGLAFPALGNFLFVHKTNTKVQRKFQKAGNQACGQHFIDGASSDIIKKGLIKSKIKCYPLSGISALAPSLHRQGLGAYHHPRIRETHIGAHPRKESG